MNARAAMAMKIYFCGSISGGRNDAQIYHKIVEHMKTYGTVLTEHVGSIERGATEKLGPDENLTDKEIHDRDMDWLRQSDVVVAEVTTPSLGVGYEIGRSLDMGKNILCLFRMNSGRRLSAMIAGAPEGENGLLVKRYETLDEALVYVGDHLKAATKCA